VLCQLSYASSPRTDITFSDLTKREGYVELQKQPF